MQTQMSGHQTVMQVMTQTLTRTMMLTLVHCLRDVHSGSNKPLLMMVRLSVKRGKLLSKKSLSRRARERKLWTSKLRCVLLYY
jgi:hypothetical protein